MIPPAQEKETFMSDKILRISLVVLALVLAAGFGFSPSSRVALAQQAPAGEAINAKDISLSQAEAIVQAAIEKSRSINTKMNIAVVDAGGNLKAFARMDGAWLGSIDISIKKAKTARYFDMPTGEIG